MSDLNIQRGKANDCKGNIRCILLYFASADSKSGHGGIVGVTLSKFFPRRCSSDRFVSNPTPQSKDQTGDSVPPLPAKHKHMPALPHAVALLGHFVHVIVN